MENVDMKKKISVFKVILNGHAGVICDMNDVLEDVKTHLESANEGDSITIESIKMTGEELEDLPEFEGY